MAGVPATCGSSTDGDRLQGRVERSGANAGFDAEGTITAANGTAPIAVRLSSGTHSPGGRCSRAAAAAWERIGDAYQRALELAESDEPEPTVQALLLLEALGARPAIALVRQRLRRLGVTQIPRGPNPATCANPAGLTDRQVEIVVLLTAGLTNAEIAARLVVSIRTVDHHVSAVLQKLGVHTRRDVASAAVALGLAR